jgi:hypothetical protein
MMNRIRFAAGTLAVAVGFAAVGGGCSKDGGAQPSSRSAQPTPTGEPPPTTTITPTPTPKTRKELATEQLLRYLNIRDNSFRAGKVNLRRLARVATGDKFLEIPTNVAEDRRDGVRLTGRYVHILGEPRDFNAYIQIDDCEDRGGIKRRSHDKLLTTDLTVNGDPAPNPMMYHYKLIRVDGKGPWKVSEYDLTWDKPC